MKRVIAFADEFGNNSFSFDKQGSHFIVASIIVNHDDLEELESQLESIRRKHFQTGEIKSSKVSGNHTRRIKILEEIAELKFSVYALIVDKRKLNGEGFKYKKSFYKFLNGLLYKELYKTFPKLELIVDEHGGNDFMLSFKKYVQRNHIRDLFAGSEFNVSPSHNQLGVQLADMMAGTLGFIFDELKKSENSDRFLDIIRSKVISLNQFPKPYNYESLEESTTSEEYDSTIAELCLNRIFDYLDISNGDKQDELDRINFLKLLLLFHQSNHFKKYTTSTEFIRHLNYHRESDLSKEQFSTKIIAKLRDEGILISSSRDGYKIPSSANDMKTFIRHGKGLVVPVLRRINQCREAIKLATNNEYDILNEAEFVILKKLIDL
jgi:hypothetical protein